MESYLQARWPSRPGWSPDGRYISFLSTDWKTQDLYVVAAEGGAPIALTRSSDFLGGSTWNSAGQFGDWSPDAKHILYSEGGDLYLVSVPQAETRRLTETAESEDGGRFSPDGRRIAYARGGNLFVLAREEMILRQLTRDGRAAGGFSWSPDGRHLSLSVADPPTRLSASPPYSGPLLTIHRMRPHQRDAAIVPGGGGELRTILASPEQEAVLDWHPDGQSLLIQRTTIDAKERWLFWVGLDGKTKRTLYHQRDEKYLATNDQVAMFSPDGRSLLLTSDQDGWNHLYVIRLDGGEPLQITRGRFEVSFPAWAPNGETVFFTSTEAGSEQRQIYSVPSAGGARKRLTTEPGVNTTAVLSPAADRLAFIHSDPARLPDLWVLETRAGALPRQLTDSMTPELKAFRWQTPQIVTYPGKDGLAIRAQLFLPPGLDRKTRHPAVVHVHQAAIYQEVYLGPGPQKDNVCWYGWHQRLAQKGYVVLNVDFRGSYGYGRDFRTANHLKIGVDDAEDVVQGVEYLKRLGYVDPGRIGVYGMSYGGHMVLTLLAKYPHLFQAGVNIAGVFDYLLEIGPWAVRNAWMYQRLGTPEDNPEAYYNASASNFIDRLKAPVLTLQGTNDTNVTLLQSIKLVDELLRRGKRFEFEIYPGEVHFFGRRQSWVDAFGKMERFFEEHLAGGAVSPTSF
jgi:dipeptidyl aminopeptidase/acylaminoacyl peptidase